MKSEKLKILVACSKNSGKIAPFILDQAESLKAKNMEIDFFIVSRKGFLGYLKSRKGLKQKIKEFRPDIIHAHYGLSGLLANLQRKIPVITTYHGSDINLRKIFRFSKMAIFLSKYNVFVSQKNMEKAKPKRNYALIPCGVDTDLFKPLNKEECRQKLGLGINEKIILFSASFDNKIKNSALAKAAVAQLNNVKLIELKNYTREEVVWLMNASDAVLMTSHTEGSPQFIKEAMAANCPVVSVDVGDVSEIIGNTENCFICAHSEKEIAEALQKIFVAGRRTAGREKILNLDNKLVADKIIEVYKSVL